MLKKRIIPIQLLQNGRLVKGCKFSDYRDVGAPASSAAVYNSQYADELLFLNINGPGIEPLLDILAAVSQVSFIPLAVGGGIRSYEDAAQLIRQGADKIVLNSICYTQPQLIQQIANQFGSQAVVCAVDFRRQQNNIQLYSALGEKKELISLETHLNTIQEMGAGEILLQSIDNDGCMAGFDLELIARVAELVKVPLIAAGGSGNYEHLRHLFEATQASAAACGSLFNFSDSNPMRAIAFLRNYGLPFKRV